jgi:hypothetical protein
MRDYLEAASLPLVKIGGIPVPRLILGHLPFVGESYQGPEKNRELASRFSNVENTVKILSRAVAHYGVAVIGAQPSEGRLASLFLEAVRKTEQRTSVELALIACFRIPLVVGGKPVDDYRRWLTYYQAEKKVSGEVLKKYMEDPVLLCRENWEEKFRYTLLHGRPYERREIENMKIDFKKLDEAASSLQGFRLLFTEPGSETDFLTLTDRLDLLGEVVSRLQDRLGCATLLGIHHAGLTVPVLEKAGIRFEGYVTPVNRRGIMMFPTQEAAVEALKAASRPVIAIKPLGGGRIPPETAFRYVYSIPKVAACMVGVASERELDEAVSRALKAASLPKE